MAVIPRPMLRTFLLCIFGALVLFFIARDYLQFKTPLSYFASRQLTVYLNPSAATIHKNGTKRELLLLQMLFRHGHRAPFMLYPTDPNNETFWKEGLGTLTRLGRVQHYRLGRHLQDRYKDFITTNPKEVELVSAESSRTQHGAYSFLAGLYSPKEEFQFTNELLWQPIISKNSGKYNNILTRSKCERLEKEFKALKNSKLANDTRARFEGIYKFWSTMSGRVIDDWHLANDLGKTFACEKKYNLTIPDWAYKYWKELQIQTALNYYFHYGTKELLRYRIGPLIGFMVEKMKDRIKMNREKRVYIYSAHGSYIAQTLMILNRYNWREPPPASTMVLELWKEEDDYTIRWLYFNSTSPEIHVEPPYIIHFDICGEFCSLSKFMAYTEQFIPKNYTAECNDTSKVFKSLDLIADPTTVLGSCSGKLQISHFILTLIVSYYSIKRIF
ncbi:prostatic acid phosphatase-like [Parasteatoda tepidariorum]|uniref:prostatic acid phosphatase-like n=1 Tax=Parasteatoda tepidariorum TaxID=114398 RepID=UPI00077FD292|nr:prostatic acid phosphatase-like [Parasteatoda tepidariorum]